ncbi:LCP family protein [Clostridium oryzae]|uniref:Putative transcriptional regulator YwtF n=1 Tax=Clostridium oryzae TaxID=1450648 RepID=A0A1V4I811_9CLOT|nr:LCP family protein [Clostridium oryzae]OPJ55687.1 putative transcriptional regulator YwtF [Clostridium oryzae]
MARVRKKKKRKTFLIVILTLLVLFAAVAGVTMLYINNSLSKINHVEISQDPADLGIDTNTYSDDKSTTIDNILLMGVDSRDPKKYTGLSDAMMILTVDKKNKKLKLTSILRDSVVNIEGHGLQKLTHSHNFGGPELTIKTINENYNMNIKNYVQVNFFTLQKIIDDIGGVTINIKPDEVKWVNGYCHETARIEKRTPDVLKGSGPQKLTGMQAVAYARIRYVGTDFERTARQRRVLSAIFQKLAKTNITDIPKVANEILPNVETSLSSKYISSTAIYVLTHGLANKVEQNRVPYDGLYSNGKINGQDVIQWNKEENIKKMHDFIFGTDISSTNNGSTTQ